MLYVHYIRLLDLVESWIPRCVTPNHLSWSRVAALPIIMIAFLGSPWIAFAIYTVACVTDIFDGHIARKRGMQTDSGKRVDEITDKLYVYGIVLFLLWQEKIPLEPLSLKMLCVIAILVRDVLISVLRQWRKELARKIPSHPLAKWKTVIFMAALGCLIVGDPRSVYLVYLDQLGIFLLPLAATLALVSGAIYSYKFASLHYNWVRA